MSEKRFPWGELTDLYNGRIHEINVELPNGDEVRYAWGGAKPPRLLWSEKKHALLWWGEGRAPKLRKTAKPRKTSEAAKAWRRWNGKAVDGGFKFRVPAAELELTGKARRIYYSSDKYKDGEVRHHDFGGWVRLRQGKAGGLEMFEVRGGDLRITAKGIHG